MRESLRPSEVLCIDELAVVTGAGTALAPLAPPVIGITGSLQPFAASLLQDYMANPKHRASYAAAVKIIANGL
jgi:hypothetical protein